MATDDWPDHPFAQGGSAAGDSTVWPDHPLVSGAQPMPWYEKLGQGIADPAMGLAQLGAHLGIGGSGSPYGRDEMDRLLPSAPGDNAYVPPSEILKTTGQQQADYEARRKAAGETGPDWWRAGGNMLTGTLLPGGAGSLGARIGTGALQGAGMGLAAPADEASGDYWTQKARDVVLGGALGTVGGAIGGAVRGAPTADQQLLQGAGVYLSPGASGGRLAEGLEGAVSKVPVAKSFVQSTRDRMIDSFNLALHNDVLGGIGQQLPRDVSAGQQAFTHTMGAFNKEYEDLLPQLSFRPGQTFYNGLSSVYRDVQLLPTPMQNQFSTLIQQRLLDPLQKSGGRLPGDAMKLAETDMRKFGDRFAGQGGNEGVLADAINGVRRAMRQQLRDDFPQAAPKLDALDRGYARLQTLKDAGLSSTTQGAVPTPAQVLQAIRKNTNPNDVLRGGAPMQDLADAAQRVIGSNRSAGRGPATASDMFLTEILGSRLGVGGALAGSAGVAAAPEGYVPDWLKYSAAGLLALPAARAGLNTTFSPGRAGRTLLSQTPIGAAAAWPGLLNQGY